MQQDVTITPATTRASFSRAKPIEKPHVASVEIRQDSPIVKYTYAGDRYWFWLREDGDASWLFRERGLEGPSMTRGLNPDAKVNAPIVEQVLAIVRADNLVQKAHWAAEQHAARAKEHERESAIDYAKSECGPALYAALKDLLRCSAIPESWAEPARAALAQADAKIDAATDKL